MVSSVQNWVPSSTEGGMVQASTAEWVAQKTELSGWYGKLLLSWWHKTADVKLSSCWQCH
jgi:hypothetical protein